MSGSIRSVSAEEDVLAYERWDETRGRHLLVVLNLGGRARELRARLARRRVLVSTHLDRGREVVGDRLALRPDEGVILGPP
jgi:hypothetical protein